MSSEAYPYLERLQEKMEERLARKVPAAGRFCGTCYGRLRESDTICGFCAQNVSATGTVSEIPQAVLRAYRAKQRIEARWVYGFAFIGLGIAMALFLLMVGWGPGFLGNPGLAFAVLIGGGYLLARAIGELVGGSIGYRKAVAERERLWAAHVREREQRPTP